MSGMEFLDKLLHGVSVEWHSLGHLEDSGVLKLGRGNVISKSDLSSFPGNYPVYSSSASGSGIFGRYGKFMFEDERITWSIDGGGRFFHRQAHRYSVTNVCGWLRVNDTTVLNTRFLFHVLSGAWETKIFDYTKKAHPSVIRDEYIVPVPTIEIQSEIVRILDAFTKLTTELTTELTIRKKQYNYYRDQLLSFEDGEVEWKTLGSVTTIKTGQAVNKQMISANPGEYAVINSGREPLGFINEWNTDKDPIGITSRGAGVGSITWQCGKYFRGNLNYSATIKNENEINTRYLYHILLKMQLEIQALCTFDGIPALNAGNLKELEVPIPPLVEQARIVAILDKFDALTNSLTEGLPREIGLRQKQYEYYRDLLVSFPKPEGEKV